MSKRETPITRWYWQQVGGLLVEEYCLVQRGTACARRLVDALVLPERETRIAVRGEPIHVASGERAVLVQTKDLRLGMYLMGQTLFSMQLLRGRYPGAAIESVALCTRDDEVLRPLLEAYEGCRVVIAPESALSTARDIDFVTLDDALQIAQLYAGHLLEVRVFEDPGYLYGFDPASEYLFAVRDPTQLHVGGTRCIAVSKRGGVVRDAGWSGE